MPMNAQGLPQDASASSQRARILARLRKGPMTTTEARRELDILMPAARVFELRHNHGFDIPKRMVKVETAPGKWHRVALYSLMKEAQDVVPGLNA